MSIPDVVLVGYYGRGNFGDDVLMTVTHSIARSILPRASIGIRLGSDVSYPSQLIGEDMNPVSFGTRDIHQLIIHGGGGTFFDFSPHSLADRGVNSVLLSGGTRGFVRIDRALRRLTNRSRMSALNRIGLGLGIGTFTPGSKKLLAALPLLDDFDHLWVRDPSSISNLDNLSVGPSAILGSDLAFLSDCWCPTELILRPRATVHRRPRVGVILRDWPAGSGADFAGLFRPVISALSAQYDLTIISFDPATDRGTLQALKDWPQQQWQAGSTNLQSFLKALSDYDVLLTSRAHGAICGACVGRPSVILEIEPKLAAINAMLPQATRIASPRSDAATVGRLIEEALSISGDCIAEDFIRNKKLSEEALSRILEGLEL